MKMTIIEETLKSKRKPKEKVTLLAKKVKENKKLLDEIVTYFEKGSIGEKGHCMEAVQFVSRDKLDLVMPYLDFVIEHLEDDGGRIKWEAAEIIVNVAKQFPDKTTKAIPKLLENTKDKGTIVRWSAANALGEIAKHNPKAAKTLAPKMKELAKKETNNGVKNVYLKALKILEKK